nr:PE family protein [Mycobacterium pseudoshottsii]
MSELIARDALSRWGSVDRGVLIPTKARPATPRKCLPANIIAACHGVRTRAGGNEVLSAGHTGAVARHRRDSRASNYHEARRAVISQLSGVHRAGRPRLGPPPRAPALLISRLVSWVDDLWCRAIGAGV